MKSKPAARELPLKPGQAQRQVDALQGLYGTPKPVPKPKPPTPPKEKR